MRFIFDVPSFSVPSQVMLSKNLNDPKRSMSIASKMMIQMSCKLGGAPWRVAIPPQVYVWPIFSRWLHTQLKF